MIYRIAIAAIILLLGGMALAINYQSRVIANLNSDLIASQVQYAGCSARLDNILEDRESDRQINLLSDDDLRFAPDHWLFTP